MIVRKTEKILLVLTGVFMPLITIRIDFPILSISVFLFMLGLLLVLNGKQIFDKLYFNKNDIFIFIFLLIALISIFNANNMEYGLNQWIKMLLVILIFFLLRTLFIVKPFYVTEIMKFASLSLGVYLLYLIWLYIIINKQSYIGLDTSTITKAGKNALAFMVAILLPYILVVFFKKFIEKQFKLIQLLILLIVLIGSLFIQSRGLFLVVLLYFILLIVSFKFNYKILMSILMSILIIGTIFMIIIPEEVVTDITDRFASILILTNDEIATNTQLSGGSIDSRQNLINKGINMFIEKPIFGHGLGSYRYYKRYPSPLSHNDYIQVLSELGVVGLVSFLLIIIDFMKKGYLVSKFNKNNIWLFLAVCGISFYLLMINAFDNILLWFIYAVIASEFHRMKRIKKNN